MMVKGEGLRDFGCAVKSAAERPRARITLAIAGEQQQETSDSACARSTHLVVVRTSMLVGARALGNTTSKQFQ
jgi:hypothetical protein